MFNKRELELISDALLARAIEISSVKDPLNVYPTISEEIKKAVYELGRLTGKVNKLLNKAR